MSPDCNIELFYCIAVPGEPYHLKNDTTPVPVPFPSVSNFSGMDQHMMEGRSKRIKKKTLFFFFSLELAVYLYVTLCF